MKFPKLIFVALIASCVLSSGCVTLGPRVETRYVVARPGSPILVLDQVSVTGQSQSGEVIDDVDIGGWVCMPLEHWKFIIDELAREQERVETLEAALEVNRQ